MISYPKVGAPPPPTKMFGRRGRIPLAGLDVPRMAQHPPARLLLEDLEVFELPGIAVRKEGGGVVKEGGRGGHIGMDEGGVEREGERQADGEVEGWLGAWKTGGWGGVGGARGRHMKVKREGERERERQGMEGGKRYTERV